VVDVVAVGGEAGVADRAEERRRLPSGQAKRSAAPAIFVPRWIWIR
jgi:hypothetical protein